MKNATFKGIAAFAFCAALLAGGGAVGYGAGTNWTYKRDNVQITAPDDVGAEIANGENSMQLSEAENNGATFKARTLKTTEYREYDIDVQSVESAYSATVTLANHNEATDKSITLTAEFADGTSAAEYISFSKATVQSGEEFTISCLKAFGQPITIKGTANGVESGAKPTCSIKADYVRRFKAVYMTGGEIYHQGGVFEYGRPYFSDMRLSADGGTGEMYVANCDAIASIYIKTDLNSTSDMSVGTITEGIKDVKIDYTVMSQSADSIQWDMTKVETNLLEANPSTNQADLFYFYDFDEDYMASLGMIINAAHQEAGNYSSALNKYNSHQASIIIAVQFTGKITGITYTFASEVVVNPEGLYVNAQSPMWNIDDLIF